MLLARVELFTSRGSKCVFWMFALLHTHCSENSCSSWESVERLRLQLSIRLQSKHRRTSQTAFTFKAEQWRCFFVEEITCYIHWQVCMVFEAFSLASVLQLKTDCCWSFFKWRKSQDKPSWAWFPFSRLWSCSLSSCSCWTWTCSSSHLLFHCCSVCCSSWWAEQRTCSQNGKVIPNSN